MAVERRPITAVEFERLPVAGQRRELVRGDLLTTTRGGKRERLIADRLACSLRDHVTAHNLGAALANDAGFLLAINPDTVRSPVIALIGGMRYHPAGRIGAFWPGPPDLAVEVVSPEDLYEDVHERVGDYLGHGAQLVFVVNPERCSVAAYGPSGLVPIYAGDDVLAAEDIVPGWILPLRELFAPDV